MNEKTAKQLRKIARTMAQQENLPARLLDEDIGKRKYQVEVRRDASGLPLTDETGRHQYHPVFVGAGQMTNSPLSERGIYRNLKKQHAAKAVF